jgi:hypothetical protein
MAASEGKADMKSARNHDIEGPLSAYSVEKLRSFYQ